MWLINGCVHNQSNEIVCTCIVSGFRSLIFAIFHSSGQFVTSLGRLVQGIYFGGQRSEGLAVLFFLVVHEGRGPAGRELFLQSWSCLEGWVEPLFSQGMYQVSLTVTRRHCQLCIHCIKKWKGRVNESPHPNPRNCVTYNTYLTLFWYCKANMNSR